MTERGVLEIETVTKLRGSLAERLIKLAADTGRTPVDAMADIVESGLSNTKHERIAEAEIKGLRNEVADLRLQLQKTQSTLSLSTTTRLSLKEEAQARKMGVDQLIKGIIEIVADDKLFAAVLDA